MPRRRAVILAARDEECRRAEEALAAASNKAMRSFLKRVNVEVKLGLRNPGLTAAALPQVSFDLFSLEQARGWWAESLDQDFLPELAETWRAGYWNETTIATGLDAVPQYLARVRDRLVPGVGPMTSPAIPDDAFNMARSVINRALAVGDGPKELARALAATFSWDQDQPYWERRKADADAEIDRILDAIGPPGSEAREIAKRSDPRVIALRQERNLAQSNIDSVQSTWQTRADRIARTESTGALNAGAMAAMQEEGVSCVEWLATNDSRTRPSHRRVHGEKVALGTRFSNGLLMPGEAGGPAREVVNCRCAIVACETDELPETDR